MMLALAMLALAMLAAAGAVATPADKPAEPDPWPDSVVLKNDSVVRCRILAATPSLLSIEYPKPAGPLVQQARRELKWSDLKVAEFSMEPEFHRLIAADAPARDTAQIATRWSALAAMVDRPNHPAGELALAWARRALNAPDAPARHRALDACRAVAARDWNPSRRAQARWHIIQLRAALGQPNEALHEARAFVTEMDIDPEALMPALVFVARGDFAALRQLEEDNPRWIDDDLVRPDRMALFHRTIDTALKPALFAGGLEGPASDGLSLVIDILEFAGNRDTAADTARDLITLYPDSRPATRARKFLDQHKLPLNPTPEPADSDPPATPGETATPATETPKSEPPVRRRPRYAEITNPSPPSKE